MWKNKMWTGRTRWIVSSIFVILIAVNAISNKENNINDNKKSESTNVASTTSITSKVTFSEAEAFMQSRCISVGQTLMEKKTVNFNGTKLYMFLSVAENGYVCISSVSENALEVLASDCGLAETKIQQWDAVK